MTTATPTANCCIRLFGSIQRDSGNVGRTVELIDPVSVEGHEQAGTPDELKRALESESGLLGLSGVSSDLRDVKVAADRGNPSAALALDVFVYRARKCLGPYLAVLGSCDAVAFTGGIGENAAFIRSGVLAGLGAFGLHIDEAINESGADCPLRISEAGSPVEAWVVATDEELLIARDTYRLTASGTHTAGRRD